MLLSQFVAIFLLEEVAFLLYTLLVLRSSQFCFEKVGPAIPPGLISLLLSVADEEIIPIRVSLSQAKCVWLNAAVVICQRYRLSEHIALLMYTLMILKRSDRFRWA